MTKTCFFLCLSFFLTLSLQAQQELGTHFMRNLWQSGLSNPALVTGKKIEIGLPGFYANAAATGFEFGDLVRTDAEGRNVIDAAEILADLDDNNYVLTDFHIETIRLGIQIKDLQLSFYHGLRLNSFINYPKNLAEFIFLGNAGFVGQTMDLGPDIQLTAYNEFAFGAAQKFGKLGLGLRLKFLTGIGNASTENRQVDLFTDEDVYQLSLQTNYLLNTSSYFRINSSDEFNLNSGIGDFSATDIFTKNSGLAFDFGLTYDITDKWQVAASVTDIGKINWKENLVNYRSNKTINYDGITLDSLLQESTIPLNETLDSLRGLLAFSESAQAYSTSLPVKTYISSTFRLNDRWTFGALFHTASFRGETDMAVALNAQAKFGKLLSVGTSYAIRNQRYDNIGLNFALHLGPVGIFAMTDNILAAVQPQNSRNFNLRSGLNLQF